MKCRNIKILLGMLICLTCAEPSTAQQNIQLTQYIFNSLSVNPAYAGYKEEWFAQMALRSQWVGMQDAPKTGQISIDGILDPEYKKIGAGLQASVDRLGPQSTTSAYLNYAYRLPMNEKGTRRLSLGFAAGVSQYAIDYTKLTPIDDGDAYATQGETSRLAPDVRIGIYYHSPKWYLGASVLDLLSSVIHDNQSTSQGVILNNRHLYLMSGMLLDINPEIKLRPSLLVKEDFKGPTSLDVNSMVIFKDVFWIGASYRTGLKLWTKTFEEGQSLSASNSVAGLAQFFLNKSVRFGYSYDHTMSRLGSIENGSHEITLGISFAPKPLTKVLTPRFF